MAHIAMILRKPPYGDINAAEAVRHAMGAVSGDWKVSFILLDGGVLLARAGQDDSGTGYTNLEAALRDCAEMGVEVYADNLSLIEQSVKQEEIVPGIEVRSGADIAAILRNADQTMIF